MTFTPRHFPGLNEALALEPWQLQLRRIVAELPTFAFRYRDEVQLHEGIAEALTTLNVAYVREHVASPRHRFDFLCNGIVIEVKIHGSFTDALRQVDRYCELAEVKAIVLVTTRSWSVDENPLTLREKSVHVIRVGGQAF